MTSDAIGRIAERMHNFSRLISQVTRNQISDNEVAEDWPLQQQNFLEAMEELMAQVKDLFGEVDAYTLRRAEEAEVLEMLTNRIIDVVTIIGSGGESIKILTQSDSNYISGIMTGATDRALKEAVSKLDKQAYDRLATLMKQHELASRNKEAEQI